VKNAQKLEQAENKIKQSLLKNKSDSMDLVMLKTQLKIANTHSVVQFNLTMRTQTFD
jgi:hypothetical protein